MTPSNHPEVFFYVSVVYRGNENDQRRGVVMYPFLTCLREGIPRRHHKVWDVLLIVTALPLCVSLRFGCIRDWLKQNAAE